MSATFKLDANSAGAVKAVQDFNKALDQSEKEADSAAKASKRMADEAKRIHESVDPVEKYNNRIKRLAELVTHAGLNHEAARQKAALYGLELGKVSDAGDKAFDVSKVAQYVSGVELAKSAAEGLRDMLREVNAERIKAAEGSVNARSGMGSLAQLAATEADPTKAYADYTAEARHYQSIGAVPGGDANAAGQLTFDMAAAGLKRSDREFAARALQSGLIANAGTAASSYDAIKTALGEAEVGDFKGVFAKMLAAGSAAPGSPEELLQAAARGGSSAKALGISDEELLSLTAILAKEAGSASEGGTKAAAFLRQLEQSKLATTGKLAGQDLEGMLGLISALPEKQQGYGGIMGNNAEGVAALRTLLGNQGDLSNLIQKVERAPQSGLADVAVALPNSDPQQRAANRRNTAAGRLAAVTGKQMSEGQNLLQSLMDEQAATMRVDAPGWWTEMKIWADRQVQEKIPFVTPESMLRSAEGNGLLNGMPEDLAKDIRDFNRRQAEAAERSAAALERMEGRGRGRAPARPE